MLIVNVLVEYGVYKLDRTYSYFTHNYNIKRGMRTLVRFNNREIVGIVLSVEESDLSLEDYEAIYGFIPLEVIDVLDDYVILNEDLSVELRDELINKFPLDGYVNKKSMQELIQDYLDRYDAQSNGVSHFNISEHIGAIRVLNDLLYDIENMM